jgi:hypothetical protein
VAQDPSVLGSYNQFPEMGVSSRPYTNEENTNLMLPIQVEYFNSNNYDGRQDGSYSAPTAGSYYVEEGTADPIQQPVQPQHPLRVTITRSTTNSIVSPQPNP